MWAECGALTVAASPPGALLPDVNPRVSQEVLADYLDRGRGADAFAGPTAHLNENKIVAGEAIVLAKEIRAGSHVWTLRDAAGLPLWRGRRRSR